MLPPPSDYPEAIEFTDTRAFMFHVSNMGFNEKVHARFPIEVEQIPAFSMWKPVLAVDTGKTVQGRIELGSQIAWDEAGDRWMAEIYLQVQRIDTVPPKLRSV